MTIGTPMSMKIWVARIDAIVAFSYQNGKVGNDLPDLIALGIFINHESTKYTKDILLIDHVDEFRVLSALRG